MMQALLEQLEEEMHDVELTRIIRVRDNELDKVEEKLQARSVEHPMNEVVTHRFTPHMYIREIFMPAGSMLTSKIHRTEHPYVISKGKVSVWSENDGVQRLRAPYTGITKPGTRRLLYIHEDTIWTTFHVTEHTDVGKIEADIIEPHHNPLLLDAEQMKELMS